MTERTLGGSYRPRGTPLTALRVLAAYPEGLATYAAAFGSTVSYRALWTLADNGLVRRAGKRSSGGRGAPVIWQVTEAGRELLAAID